MCVWGSSFGVYASIYHYLSTIDDARRVKHGFNRYSFAKSPLIFHGQRRHLDSLPLRAQHASVIPPSDTMLLTGAHVAETTPRRSPKPVF